MLRGSIFVVVLAFGALGPAAAQEALGAREYARSCQACHGAAGRGDGPLAPYLSVAPSDLTRLGARNGGSFPHAVVFEMIAQGGTLGAHGGSAMPVWGDRYRAEARMPAFDVPPAPIVKQEVYVRAKIGALVAYLESLQADAP